VEQDSSRSIAAVAFDLDGLMFNTEDLYDEVIDAVLQDRGHRFSRDLKLRMMGLPGLKAVAVMIEEFGLKDTQSHLLDELHDRMKQLLPGRLLPMPGLLDLLCVIEEAGLPKSIATSSSPEFAASAMAISGLTDRFRFVLTSQDVTNGKPFPDIYLESAQRHGVPAGSLLVLEDSLIGSRAAAASGAISVAVPGHHSIDQDFAHVDYRFDSLEAEPLQQMLRKKSAR